MKPLLRHNWNSLSPNEKRTLRQEEIHQEWLKAKAKGYALAVTGFGKSRLGEKAIKRCLEGGSDRKINVVVPSTLIRDQWELMAYKKGWSSNVSVYVGASYLKLPIEERICGLLLVDECHRFSNEESLVFSKIVDSTKKHWVLCLSATMTKEQRSFLESRGIGLVGEVTMEEANRESYVAKNALYALSLGMNAEDEEKYRDMTNAFNGAASFFGHSFDEAKRIMQKDSKEERDSIDTKNDWKPGTTLGLARTYFTSMAERKTFLQTPNSKIDAVVKLCDIFKSKKIITFSEHTSFVSKINERLGDRAVEFHANINTQYFNPKGVRVDIDAKQFKLQRALGRKYTRIGSAKLRKSNLEKFNNSKNMIMNTAKAVDEGADIHGVDMAIIVSYSSTPRQLLQRIGRAIRFMEDKHAVIVILYVNSGSCRTQELNWLKKASKGLPLKWVKSIDSIIEDLTKKGYPPR